MKAIVYDTYGSPDVLKVDEIPPPTVANDELLIEVKAAALNALDWHYLRGDPFFIRLSGAGLLRPRNRQLGVDVAGRVASVGKNVTAFQPGDEVFGSSNRGAFAEFVSARESGLVHKPPNVTFEQAAAVPVAATTALQGLRAAGQIKPGQKVLIHGASGGVGTFAVQIAKGDGAEVTAVCSTRNVEMVRSIGADHVIDYTQEDFAESSNCYDVILAVNGDRSIFEYRRALCATGTYVTAGGSMRQLFQAILLGRFLSLGGGKRLLSMGIAQINKEDLAVLQQLLANGKVVPVIDRAYPLSEVAAAIRYMEDVHASGKIVISL